MSKTEKKQKNIWDFLQNMGKTFMLPVALLAFMGLILGIGSSFTSDSMIEIFPFLENNIIQLILKFLATVGGFAFTYLPVLFAIAIPIGLVKNEKGVAAFSGFVGYTIMNLAINFYLTESHQLADSDKLQQAGQSSVLGIQTLEMGVLGGIISGLIVYRLHEKFTYVQLPDSFAFFSGSRFVPIVTSLVLSVVGLIIPIIWPFFGMIIAGVGTVIQHSGVFGPFLFGAGERLLLPIGLHHILVSMVRFTEVGGHTLVEGKDVFGALNIFYAQLQNNIPIKPEVTAFLSQGKMPTFMFGLPAAALAIYHAAPKENRHKIKGLLISGFVATFITGITEPIEFLFLFISPILWIFHVFMTGLGFMTMNILGVTIGNTDGGFLDFIIFGVMQGSYTKWWLVIIVGIVWFVIYYFTFKTIILKFDLKTPGRNQNKSEGIDEEVNSEVKTDSIATGVLEAIGGSTNIITLDNCITRLRLVLKDGDLVDDDKLKELGILGVVHLDKQNVQVIIGTRVTTVRKQLDAIL
nr:maltose/glucose-specific PTS transporter subunit IIBC [Mammaliicoccus sp. Marseille-Q6498]